MFNFFFGNIDVIFLFVQIVDIWWGSIYSSNACNSNEWASKERNIAKILCCSTFRIHQQWSFKQKVFVLLVLCTASFGLICLFISRLVIVL